MGAVHFVGAGPGDPGLLTVRGAELLRRASFVLHDRDLDGRLLEDLQADADVRAVGEGEGPEARAELLAAAAEGGIVVRLCTGDALAAPGVVREAVLLRRRGVAVELTPGLLPQTAIPTLAGVPLTLPDGDDAPPISLAAGAAADGAFGVDGGPWAPGRGLRVLPLDPEALEPAVARLLARGWEPDTAAAAVFRAGAARQRTVSGELSDLPALVAAAALEGPLLLLVGPPVAQRARLEWFESRPLFGKRIVVTRARAQAGDFVATLEQLGAEVISFPVIRIAAPPDPGPLRAAAAAIRGYDWIVFTSVNGVERFHLALEDAGQDVRALAGPRIAAIGPATAAALETWGIRADLIPDTYIAEAVLEAMARLGPLEGTRVLLPRAFGAREVLPLGLEALGATVDEVEAYRSLPDAEGAAGLRNRIAAGEVDVVTFTSSSTVTHFVEAAGANLYGAVAACIGPITARTAQEAGLPVAVVAQAHTIPGLTVALLHYFADEGRGEA